MHEAPFSHIDACMRGCAASKHDQITDAQIAPGDGLAEFIDTITGSIPADWAVDVTTALSLVKLAEMQKALGSGLRHGHSQPLTKAAGDFDFF